MSRPSKRAKLESRSFIQSPDDSPTQDVAMADEEDPLAAIAMFLAPTTTPARPTVSAPSRQQPPPSSKLVPPNSNKTSAAAAASSSSSSSSSRPREEQTSQRGGMFKTPKPKLESRDRAAAELEKSKHVQAILKQQLSADDEEDELDEDDNSDDADEKDEQASREKAKQEEEEDNTGKTPGKSRVAKNNRRQKSKVVPSTQRLGNIAKRGLVQSSLPLLSALVQQRLDENNYPAAAEGLQVLFQAIKLDVDTVFKAAVEVMEKNPPPGSNQRNQNNILIRFYKKLMNLFPKNVIQVILELSYLFLSQGATQEAFDHLSQWGSSHIFTQSSYSYYEQKAADIASSFALFTNSSSSSAAAAAVPPAAEATSLQEKKQALTLLQGLLGVLAWESSKDAHAESEHWARLVQKKQDGESGLTSDEDDDDGYGHNSSSQRRASVAHHHRGHHQSMSELMAELRTSQQKRVSFGQIAREKLRTLLRDVDTTISGSKKGGGSIAASNNQPAGTRSNSLWLWYYLESMDSLYQQRLNTPLPANASLAAKSTHLANQEKLSQLNQRLVRKIDEFISRNPSSPTGFHIKLYCLLLFRSHSSDPSEEHIPNSQSSLLLPASPAEFHSEWVTIRHLLLLDPCSNIAIERAWQLWTAQGYKHRSKSGTASSSRPVRSDSIASAATAVVESFSIGAVELLELFAKRLDVMPEEEWSWLCLARLLATTLNLNDQQSPITSAWRLESEPVDIFATVTASQGEVDMSDEEVKTPLLRPRISAPESGSDSSALSTPMSTPRANSKKRKQLFPTPPDLPPVPPLPPMSPASSVPSSPGLMGRSVPLPPSRSDSMTSGSDASSTGRDEFDAGPPSKKTFTHNLLSSIPTVTEQEMRAQWLGRLEWWVQAIGWWRDVPQISLQTIPTDLPSQSCDRLLILRSTCYSLTLRWMKLV